MKKTKLTAVASVIVVFSMLLCVGAAADSNPEPTGYNQALLNVCDYGAIPNDGEDDTLAFSLTLNSTNGDSVYVPPGTYNISESLLVHGSSLFGAGTDKTVIIADLDAVRDPILWLGDSSQVRDLTIKFAEHCVNGTEIAGERCGIITSSKGIRRFCRGGAVSNVRIENVGTGIYSPVSTVLEKYRSSAIIVGTERWTGDACIFSATFEGISVIDFSYRGLSIEAINRTGNVWRNIYLSSGKYEANTAAYLHTEESESSIAELTVADSKLKNGVRLTETFGVSATNITFINTELTEDNTAFLYCDEACVIANGVTFKNSAPKGDKQSFIRLGDAAYRGFYSIPTNGYLHIYNMSILNPDLEVTPDASQYMIARKNGYLCEYTVDIDNLRVVAPAELKAQYEAFNYDQRDINLTLCGTEK